LMSDQSFEAELVMKHECGAACECRQDLDAALAALESSARLLSAFIFAGPIDLIDTYYATVRAAEAKLKGAMTAYREHLLEA
jgi:hypothetical protein